MTGRISVRFVACNEGKETGEQEEVKAHLMVCLDGSGMVGAGRRRRRRTAVGARETAARLLRWRIGDEEGSVSCARTRRSYWWGLRGRRRSEGVGRR